MIKKHFLLLLFVFSTFHSVFSSTAYPKPIKFTQPDGSVITITLKGDEHTKWAVTTDGYTLLSNSKGYFEYAMSDSRGYLVPSGVIAKETKKRTSEDLALLSKISKGLTYSKEQVQMLRAIKAINKSERRKVFPTTGSRKLVCILMGFKDKAFTKTQADFNNLFNQVNYTVNGATGSVKDYYLENSYGKFNLDVTVAGPYTASQNMSYYGGNDSNGDDLRPEVLVTEAVTAADAVVNFAEFDNDNDGNVDGVYVIYAGYGEEATANPNEIWAHAYHIPSKTLDGKVITNYSCSAELDGTTGAMTSIGVICHEFGHVLGAPDYYDTDYDTNGQFEGTGNWDLMAGGSWNNDGITPAHHNAYTKVYVYGWGTATTLTSGATITMPSSKTDANAYYRINSATANEYFLIENRQQTGFDASAPGHGLLIFHVSKDIDAHYDNNNINAKAPQLMYPVCASANTNPGSTATSYGNINSEECPFPGTTNKTSFTDATTPNAKSWAGENTGKPITNIIESTTTGIITFDFNGGFIGIPTNFNAVTKSTSQIDIEWVKTDNKDIVLAYSTAPTFGALVEGNEYTAGQEIVGGGTILISGNATSFSHTGLTNNKTYYYKIWSKLSSTPSYSEGIQREGKTSSGDPTAFSALKNSTSQIDLSWNKTENKGVIIASSSSPTFGQLVDGVSYTVGQSIANGGTIIYKGDANSFSNTGLNSNTAYFYKIWSTLNSNPSYSPGITAQARTACPGIVTLPLAEDFTIPSLPECWSIVDKQGDGQVWQVGSISKGLKGSYIYLDSDGYGDGNTQNADLVTPTINTTGVNSVTISFNHFFKVEESETATFSYSIDNGSTWIEVDKWTTTTANPTSYKKIIAAVANKASVKFKWNYTGTWGWYWCIDDISITETSALDIIANFKAEPTTVDIGTSTTFTDQSNGTITSWAWNFGNGASPEIATTAGPHTVTYSSLGKKTVTLTVNGNITETKTNYIDVIDPNAPVLIVGWNFEDKDVIADDGLSTNLTKTITSSPTATYNYSSGSSGSYSISKSGWDSGNGSKAWQIEFSTLGYNTITLSSKQRSSGTGPKEFKIQYKTTGTTWIDVPSSNISVAENFTSGAIANLALPVDAANQNSVFIQWVMRSNTPVSSGTTVASGGTSRIDDIVITGKKIATPVQYTLTVTKTGNGAVSPLAGDHTYDSGTSVTLTATPDQGWQFDKWEINGSPITSASTQITISANTTAVATFTQITYKLNVSHVGNGSVTPTDGESTHNSGEQVTLTATPDQGWKFDKWEVNDSPITSASTQITMNANITAVATFTLLNGIEDLEYSLKVYPNPTASIVNIESKCVIKNIQVLDLAGKVLRSSESISKDKGSVDLSRLPSGIYLLKIMSTENSIKIVKITKK